MELSKKKKKFMLLQTEWKRRSNEEEKDQKEIISDTMLEMWNSRIRIDCDLLLFWVGKNAKNKIYIHPAYTGFYFSIYFPFKIKF